MGLTAGTRLGPYEIIGPIGVGGMGEVYRARDTRLGRDVAVKVLPGDVTASPEARQRFEREARTISQLSHAHVCALFDVGRAGDIEYLVMELVDGETLAKRLGRGALPIPDVLRFGAQIAEALAAAHQLGIVHRDLKPANVMLTKSGVKLLDFGLAKTLPPGLSRTDAAEAPTASVAAPLTAHGQWLGTVPYMSPEQIEGKAADTRSDLFALGLALHEMTTGRRVFAGDTLVATASAILHTQPPTLATSRPETPAALARLVDACLIKDPDARWQSARDAAIELSGLTGAPADAAALVAPARSIRTRVPWLVAIAATIVAAVFVWRAARTPTTAARLELQIAPPASAFFYSVETVSLALSPDGNTLAFIAANADGKRQVFTRAMTAITATAVPGTETASSVFWSSDGRSLGFFVPPGQLKRLELPAGPAVTVCNVRGTTGHVGTWRGSEILFASIEGEGIHHVSVADGQVVTLVKPDPAKGETRLTFPAYLPDGRFLYVQRITDGSSTLMLGDRDKPSRPVMPTESNVAYVAPGLLVFTRDATLLAQRFDLSSGTVSGAPFPIAEPVRFFWTTSAAAFSVSARALVYQSAVDRLRLAWVDRTGRVERTFSTPGPFLDIRIVPGNRALISRALPTTGTFDIWSVDLERDTETLITNSDRGTEISPVLLPDGKTLIFSQALGGAPRLARWELGSATPAVSLTPDGPSHRSGLQSITNLSHDGRTIAYEERSARGDYDIWTMPVDNPSAAVLREPSDKSEGGLRFSPDGHWYSFTSTASGRSEIYVAPLSGGAKTIVSRDGGVAARWNPAGGELFYTTPDERMVSVRITTSPSLQIGTATTLFGLGARGWHDFDVSADGRRFLALIPDSFGTEHPLAAILNWRPPDR